MSESFVPGDVSGGAVTLLGCVRIPTRSAHAGRVSFGIRPEPVSLDGESPAVRSVISLVEPLGADTLVTVVTGDDWCWRDSGETIALTFDPVRGALFSMEGRKIQE